MNLGSSIFHKDWLTALGMCLAARVITIAIPPATIFLTGPVSFGLALAFLHKARGVYRFEFGELFSGFDNFVDTMVLGLMQILIPFLWFLIPIAGIYFGIRKAYSYSLAMYVKADNPRATWQECLKRSTALMEGYRWKLFCLQFSLIGWMILGAILCGVGILWIDPYLNACKANFYEERRRQGGWL